MMCECIFFVLTLTENLISAISYFLIFFYWPVNCANLVYKLHIAFQMQEHCFYWIAFSTGIFKEVNLFLLVYQ